MSKKESLNKSPKQRKKWCAGRKRGRRDVGQMSLSDYEYSNNGINKIDNRSREPNCPLCQVKEVRPCLKKEDCIKCLIELT